MKVRSIMDCAKVRTLPLHFAISNKMTSEVRRLVEGGANVNVRDHKKRTALMLCCFEDDEHWSAGMARMLLQAGAHAHLCDSNGRNALTFAVIFHRPSLVDILLNAIDYSLKQRDNDGKTALHYALLRGNRYVIRRIMHVYNKHFPSSVAAENVILKQIVPKNSAYADVTRSKSNSSSMQRDEIIYFNPIKLKPSWKRIIQEERDSTRVHRSSSDLNTHQFRRGPMHRFEMRCARRQRSTSLETKSLSSSSSEASSFDRVLPTRSGTPVRRSRSAIVPRRNYYSLGETYHVINNVTTNNKLDRSWRCLVPTFWYVLEEQNCPSFRPSATITPQSYEEALGLPPNEESSSEIGETLESEQQRQGRRNSSFVTSNEATTPTRNRTNSAASVESIANMSEFRNKTEFSNTNTGTTRTLKSPSEPSPDQSIKISNSNTEKAASRSLTVNKQKAQLFETDVISPSSFSSGSVKLETTGNNQQKQSKKFLRTPVVHNRPGSALRYPPVSKNEKQTQLNPITVPTDTVDKHDGIPSNTALSPSTTARNREDPVQNTNTSAFKNNPSDNSKISNKGEITKSSIGEQKRGARRSDSFLFRDRVLSDILEESEIPTSPIAPALIPLRCASAHVRGRMSSGRLLR